jgi:hypothetical protein
MLYLFAPFSPANCAKVESLACSLSFWELFNVSHDALYRHASDLFSKRRKNVTMALEKIIELADYVSMSV